MNESPTSDQLDQVFSALANPKRRAMVHDLSFRPATVGQLAKDHDLSLPAIHKHIRALEDSGLILRKKAGRTNFVALRSQVLRKVQVWITQYHTGWGSDEQTLENYIAGLQ
jgi:DNA-binding transcriptional ArsR family regulator